MASPLITSRESGDKLSEAKRESCGRTRPLCGGTTKQPWTWRGARAGDDFPFLIDVESRIWKISPGNLAAPAPSKFSAICASRSLPARKVRNILKARS